MRSRCNPPYSPISISGNRTCTRSAAASASLLSLFLLFRSRIQRFTFGWASHLENAHLLMLLIAAVPETSCRVLSLLLFFPLFFLGCSFFLVGLWAATRVLPSVAGREYIHTLRSWSLPLPLWLLDEWNEKPVYDWTNR